MPRDQQHKEMRLISGCVLQSGAEDLNFILEGSSSQRVFCKGVTVRTEREDVRTRDPGEFWSLNLELK